jgi:hypothetical protein
MSDFYTQHKFFEIVYTIILKSREKYDKEVVIINDSCSFVKSKKSKIKEKK